MSVWHVTEVDRDDQGRIRTLADLLPPEPEREKNTPPPRRRLGRLEAAGLASGLLLATILIAGLNAFWPAPAPRRPGPTVAPAPTSAPTASSTATATQEPTATPEPPSATPEPPTAQVIYVEPPCDPTVNPRFAVELDVSPYGRVRGVSCASAEEAQANADALAAEMRQAAGEK